MGRDKKDTMEDSEKWMQHSISKPGALRKTLGIKEGHNIPAKALNKAEHSKNPLTRERASLAKTFKKFRPQGR